jgi:hypothetical protein
MREIHASAITSLHRYATQGGSSLSIIDCQLSITHYPFLPISKNTRLPVLHSLGEGGLSTTALAAVDAPQQHQTTMLGRVCKWKIQLFVYKSILMQTEATRGHGRVFAKGVNKNSSTRGFLLRCLRYLL